MRKTLGDLFKFESDENHFFLSYKDDKSLVFGK